MLYFLLVKVFNSDLGEKKLFYLALGWGMYSSWEIDFSFFKHLAMYISLGIPVPIVAISAGVAHDHYGHDEL